MSTSKHIVSFGGLNGNGKPPLLPECEFSSALHRELRRSERTGQFILLVLLQLNEPGEQAIESRETIIRMVTSAFRETDTIGWYRHESTLGILVVELQDPTGYNAQKKIDARLKQILRAVLPAPRSAHIRIDYQVLPREDGIITPGDPPSALTNLPVSRTVGAILKRSMDVMGSLGLLVTLAPVLLWIIVAVKLTSRGPVLFRQTRVGERGRLFTFLKFRTMFHNNDPSLHRNYVLRMIDGEDVAQSDRSGTKIYKIVHDSRVTPLGRLLRRSSLDELPQLFNVLRGEMSLVGPRPPLPYEFERYSRWHRRRVTEVKPGLTGLWQILGRGRTSFDEMVRLDLRYASQWSLWLDIKILLRTPVAVISGVGAY